MAPVQPTDSLDAPKKRRRRRRSGAARAGNDAAPEAGE
jgi:hypothetical protein